LNDINESNESDEQNEKTLDRNNKVNIIPDSLQTANKEDNSIGKTEMNLLKLYYKLYRLTLLT